MNVLLDIQDPSHGHADTSASITQLHAMSDITNQCMLDIQDPSHGQADTSAFTTQLYGMDRGKSRTDFTNQHGVYNPTTARWEVEPRNLNDAEYVCLYSTLLCAACV